MPRKAICHIETRGGDALCGAQDGTLSDRAYNWTCGACERLYHRSPRQRGDDDGVEYGHPDEEIERRLLS